MTKVRGVSGLALAAVVGALGVAPAGAQSIGAWGSYAPSAAWPVATATNAAPIPAAMAGTGATGWANYEPAAAWTPYRPAASWDAYAPQAGLATAVVPSAPAIPSRVGVGTPIGPRNPEYGTGRTIAMHKPWLPARP